MRRKERLANDALQQQLEQLQTEAADKAKLKLGDLEDQYAKEMAAVQQQHAREVQALQHLLTERMMQAISQTLKAQVSKELKQHTSTIEKSQGWQKYVEACIAQHSLQLIKCSRAFFLHV